MVHALPEPKKTGKGFKAKASHAKQLATGVIQTRQPSRVAVVVVATARAAAVTAALGTKDTVVTAAI